MKQVQVKKLVIELNGAEVELTMAQARELRAALNEIFGEDVRREVVREPIVIPYREPWTWPYRRPYWLAASGTKFRLSDNSEMVRCQLRSQ